MNIYTERFVDGDKQHCLLQLTLMFFCQHIALFSIINLHFCPVFPIYVIPEMETYGGLLTAARSM